MNKTAKLYVRVCAMYDLEGKMVPKFLMLEDGRRYDIDAITDIRPAPALKAGGYGDRFTVSIRGKERYLFFEHNTAADAIAPGKWFVECR